MRSIRWLSGIAIATFLCGWLYFIVHPYAVAWHRNAELLTSTLWPKWPSLQTLCRNGAAVIYDDRSNRLHINWGGHRTIVDVTKERYAMACTSRAADSNPLVVQWPSLEDKIPEAYVIEIVDYTPAGPRSTQKFVARDGLHPSPKDAVDDVILFGVDNKLSLVRAKSGERIIFSAIEGKWYPHVIMNADTVLATHTAEGLYAIRANEEPRKLGDAAERYRFVAESGVVVWVEEIADGGDRDLYYYSDGMKSAQVLVSSSDEQMYPSIYRSCVLWSQRSTKDADYDIYVVNMKSLDESKRILSEPGDQVQPVYDGEYLYWVEELDNAFNSFITLIWWGPKGPDNPYVYRKKISICD